MSELPPPVEPAPTSATGTDAGDGVGTPSAGTLTPFFTTVFWVSWMGVAAGLAAVWFSARTMGFSTWWLGTEAQPRFIVVSLLPFVAPIFLAVSALRRQPWLPYLGCIGAAAVFAVGLCDIGRPAAYWVAELLIALGGLLVSVASLAGMHRR